MKTKMHRKRRKDRRNAEELEKVGALKNQILEFPNT